MASPFSYEGKRVVITGAYSGVGAALLELVADLGAEHITVIDLKEPSGPAGTFLQTDLSSEAAVEDAIAEHPDVAEVAHQLHGDGIVQTLPLRVGVARLLRGALAEGGPARIARDDARQDEHQDDDPQDHRDGRQQPTGDEAQHSWCGRGGAAGRPHPYSWLISSAAGSGNH